jgi:hypothetical protein
MPRRDRAKSGNLENPRTKSQEDRIYGELTTRTRSLKKVQGGQNILRLTARTKFQNKAHGGNDIWRAHSNGKATERSPRRKLYSIWRAYSKHKVPEHNPKSME